MDLNEVAMSPESLPSVTASDYHVCVPMIDPNLGSSR
jgi:hypothetical protein